MNMLTEVELDSLKASKTEQEWNATCDAIKKAHGGYPPDWFVKVLMSGVLAMTQANWTSHATR